MGVPVLQPLGSFSIPRKAGSSTTAYTQLIPPFGGLAGTPLSTRSPSQGTASRTGRIHVTSLRYDTPTNAHVIGLMRPLNYTTFAADAATSQAVVALTADPGVYSAGGYRYGLPNGQTAPATADNPIGANDWCVYQSADGTWHADTVASGTGTAITMTTNLPTGGVKAGGLFYYFGIITDTDPATNALQWQATIQAAASGVGVSSAAIPVGVFWIQDPNGFFNTYHDGDPALFYSPGTTAAGNLEVLCGVYAKH